MPQRTIIEIDSHSGFCAGVINAIRTAEEWLQRESPLYCLGDIVHNSEELQRLSALGLRAITHEEFQQLRHARVLIRAHGEPPETYQLAQQNHIELIDATCKVVLNLQQTIRQHFTNDKAGQILIFGKQGHAEVIGLMGQTHGQGLVLSALADINLVDTSRPAHLFAQTTQDLEAYRELITALQQRFAAAGNPDLFRYTDTICHSVVHRAAQIREFAANYDAIIFVSGAKSSNGLYLFDTCIKANARSYFVSQLSQLSHIQLEDCQRIGICGATSTPMWLMEKVKAQIRIPQSSIHN